MKNSKISSLILEVIVLKNENVTICAQQHFFIVKARKYFGWIQKHFKRMYLYPALRCLHGVLTWVWDKDAGKFCRDEM